MMNKAAAKAFSQEWKDRGDEKQDTQTFWIELLQRVFEVGRDNIPDVITFEVRTSKKKRGKDFKDAVVYRYTQNEILIEQKSYCIDLGKSIKQSDGEFLTPFEQAKRYDDQSAVTDKARWIITCNFNEFWIYDMALEGAALYQPVKKVYLAELSENLGSFNMFESNEPVHKPKFDPEVAVSVKAGELVGIMYDAFEKQYKHDENGKLSKEQQQSLNKLCVRLVFCLYAEDSGLFHEKQFHDYLESYPTTRMRRALIDLFNVLNTPTEPNQRDPYLEDDVAAFPYVNGGLFEGEIEIPNFTNEIRTILLDKESSYFDWSAISPTIFGAVFESTLNPETRRSGGMHYTSVQNIHKVIDPLFLDELKAECDRLLSNASTSDTQLHIFQNKLASLKFLDPACGSGNFLTETYLSLRKLENKIIDRLNKGMMQLGNVVNPIQVSIQQFYGIEINDFAVSVAQTALWIAEHKMFKETEKILNMNVDFLPLKTFTHIHEGNALRMEWNDVVLARQLNYIMGNPPFVGKKEQTVEQKADIKNLISEKTKTGVLDYVSCWFYKAAKIMLSNNRIKTAFVSTDSICQGEHVPSLWKILVQNYQVSITFAYRTFKWDNDATNKAEVYCVIVGFANREDDTTEKEKKIYIDSTFTKAQHINPYLLNAPDIWLSSRDHQISGYNEIKYGSMPIDAGSLILDENEYKCAITREPQIAKYLIKYAGGDELLKGNIRYCIWLKNAQRKDIISSKFLTEHVKACKEFRQSSKRSATKKLAATPELFGEIRQPDGEMIVIPKVSSKHREYIPIMLIDSNDCIVNGSALIIPNGNLYEFGILSSNVHNIWIRAIAETWGHSYQYSTDIYNNFPFPSNESNRLKIEETARSILEVRKEHNDLTLSEMYSPKVGIVTDLLKMHRANDRAVMDAYGFSHDMPEPEILTELMKLYQKLQDDQKNR